MGSVFRPRSEKETARRSITVGSPPRGPRREGSAAGTSRKTQRETRAPLDNIEESGRRRRGPRRDIKPGPRVCEWTRSEGSASPSDQPTDDGRRASEGGISSTLVPSFPPLPACCWDSPQITAERAVRLPGRRTLPLTQPGEAEEEAGAHGGHESHGFKRGGPTRGTHLRLPLLGIARRNTPPHPRQLQRQATDCGRTGHETGRRTCAPPEETRVSGERQ
ncbi:hypothetical protein NDU88_000012 [Pleurodeles waltl]|uniref:Uncharacterized protein n=1 Tax=Pleurodeles waltl TaxID=8319 RepID=A0AAV7S6Y8_PLEWA|nr:hypothetical protein NDU88_000012 [Pleurodeles waltl]